MHEHLFQPGHAQTARNIARRGWPMTYHAVCVVCGTTIDLLAAPSRSAGRSPHDMDGDRHARDAGCGGCPPPDGDMGE